jgi:hypothetical protein
MQKNILVIGHPKDTEKYIGEMVDDGDLIPVHHTVSDIGIKMYIEEAREKRKVLLAEEIALWRRKCKDILVEELLAGGFNCIAYAGKCPCDDGLFDKCRCSSRQIEEYYRISVNKEELGRAFEIVEL